jgi:hypothetical protein
MPSLIEIGLLVLEKETFSIKKKIYIVFPIVAPPDNRDHDVNNSESTLYQKVFM